MIYFEIERKIKIKDFAWLIVDGHFKYYSRIDGETCSSHIEKGFFCSNHIIEKGFFYRSVPLLRYDCIRHNELIRKDIKNDIL